MNTAASLHDEKKTENCHNKHNNAHHHEHVHCHEHIHHHDHENLCGHTHNQCPHHHAFNSDKILTIRALSGLSGDIFLAGLAKLLGYGDKELSSLTEQLNMSQLAGCIKLTDTFVNHIKGVHAEINLPKEHTHRTCADILTLIDGTNLTEHAKTLAKSCFLILAKAEAEVHGKTAEEITFHEVGALDSILDICLTCALFDKLSPQLFVCSPLPMADGQVFCAHGYIHTPVPAVLKMLENVPVVPFSGSGETVTPTALALLKTFNAKFGKWPSMTVQKTEIAYGSKIFENTATGTVFALGTPLCENTL